MKLTRFFALILSLVLCAMVLCACTEPEEDQTEHTHTAADAVKENEVAPTCTEDGSYDEVVYCTECEAEMSRVTKTVEKTGEHHYVDGVCSECGDKYVSEGLDYGLVNGDEEYAVTGIGTCTDTDLYIPSEYEGKPVTEIANEAFKDNAVIHTVTLPDTIKKVGDKAFAGCEVLIEVTMSDSVEVGKDVFRGSINVEIAVVHELIFVAAKAPSCEEAGNKEHYYCATCNEYYTDAQGQNEIFDAILPAEHRFVDGVCSECSTVLASVNIVSVDSVPYLGKFALGTLESAIGLPSEIYVTTADGARHLLPVSWDLSTYNKAVAGEYVIKGHVQAGELHFGDGVSSAIEAGIEIVEYMKGTADIVFILDISGSMSNPIANVKNNLVAFANAVDAAGISARYSIVTYSDWAYYPTRPEEQSQIIKNGASDWYITASEAATAINGIVLANGGDGPETAVDGIMLAKTALSTRQDSRVFYVLVTDYSNKIANNYGVGSMAECGQILADADINLSVICPTGYYSEYSPLTSATGGASLNISSTSFGTNLSNTLIPIIQSGVEN